MKENITLYIAIITACAALIGGVIGKAFDNMTATRALKISALQASDKAQTDRATLLQSYIDAMAIKIDSLENRWLASEKKAADFNNELGLALNRVDRLENANKDLIAQNDTLKNESTATELKHKAEILNMATKIKELQERCSELESQIRNNPPSLTGVAN